MNQVTLQQATPRAGQTEAHSDCIIEELRRYGEHLCDVCGLAAGMRSHRCLILGRFLDPFLHLRPQYFCPFPSALCCCPSYGCWCVKPVR
jgi:hypothetical protein